MNHRHGMPSTLYISTVVGIVICLLFTRGESFAFVSQVNSHHHHHHHRGSIGQCALTRTRCGRFISIQQSPEYYRLVAIRRDYLLLRAIEQRNNKFLTSFLSAVANENDDNESNASGGDENSNADDVNLMDEFMKTVKDRAVNIDMDAYGDDDDSDETEDEEEDDDDPSRSEATLSQTSSSEGTTSDDDDEADNIPASKMNIFKGRDEGGVGKLAGNVTIRNEDIYDSLKERALESPSAFINLVGGENVNMRKGNGPKQYKPPDLKPDPLLSAGEVVELVLDALNHNNIPLENYGVSVLYSYSSAASVLKSDRAPTVEEYADFIKSSEYAPLLDHEQVIIDKADYAFDKKKAFYTVRLKTGPGRQFTSVNFILSTAGNGEEDCWLIDSSIIRTEGLGRGRRKR